MAYFVNCLLVFILTYAYNINGQSDRILLTQLPVLTLYSGKMTTGRRSSPVPQLKCTGGTARCDKFTPQVVQCYNKGSDGYDVQWECKSDMDNAFRFGTIEVVCEGYHSSDDPYILRGSCGLEYTLDLTKEGHQQNKGGHDYYGGSPSHHHKSGHKQSSWLGDIILYLIVGLLVYAFYVTCLSGHPSQAQRNPGGATGGSGGGGGGGGGGSYPGTGTNRQPPGYGFRDQYTDGCGSSSQNQPSSGGGFWSGAMAGGLMGYLLGGRGGSGYGYGNGYGRQSMWGSGGQSYFNQGGGGLFGGGSSGSLFGGGGGFGGSSGTRSASGFGGTRRR